jgi:glucosamine 6-phosphate synthetase-like amidotransferase/phosphosugar isomerase protein
MKYTKSVVDADLRARVFEELDIDAEDSCFAKINDRQFGIILTDKNGHDRYVRIGAIVAEEREDMSARELMQKEIDEYNAKQAEKAEKAAKRAEKAEADKARREAKAKEKGE